MSEMEQTTSGSVSKQPQPIDDKVKELSAEINNLREIVHDQKDEIERLKSNQENLNKRLRAQERYTRKDSILVVNPPFDARVVNDVTRETLKFFEQFLKITIAYDSIKACHIIPGSARGSSMPTVICKFIYFDQKNEVWTKKWKLRKAKNPINNYNIYLNEPLPECEAEIQNEAKKRSMITTTNNCVVSVLVGGANNQTYFKKVHELSDLDNPNVIKRNQRDDNAVHSPKAKKPNNRNM